MTTRSARSRRVGQADQAGDEVEPRRQARPERDQPAGQAPGGAGTGHGGDVDPGVPPVARRDLDQAPAEGHDLDAGGALLGAEDPGRVGEPRGHVARHDELHARQRGGRAHRVERTLAPVGGGGAATADDDAARPGVPGRQEELPHAGRAGTHGILPAGPGQQGAPGRL